ncbi:MAG: ferrous iron transporter B, partial [Pirellulales bacterium]|nr:ferrous iron transporter B [Pirellulales bacterium]
FRRTILRGPSPPFLLELPSYQWPTIRVVLHRVLQRGWVFIRTAGTMILVVSILVWAALYYPHDAAVVEAPFAAEKAALNERLADADLPQAQRVEDEASLAVLHGRIEAAYQHQSILARMGRAIEPVVKPLGWDWRIGCAVLAAFPAREAVVATLGVIFAGGEYEADDPEGQTQLRAHLRHATWEGTDRPLFTLPVALSILVFFALCAQCAATLAVIRRETNSWRWPTFVFGYMTVLAYLGALATYQIGSCLVGGGLGTGG